MCHIPYATGYSLDEWKTSLNNMIEKKNKGNLVSDLRTINLMEADFNFNNHVMGKQVNRCAEANAQIPKEQYGSRKRHQARHQATNKKLLYDLNQFQRKPMILCSNDAKSCYDWIVHSIAALAMQRLGLPPQPMKCMITTLQNMNHYIRTAFGDSDQTLQGSQQAVPFQGILQGNGAGPTLWLAVSTPLFAMMKTAKHGIKYRTSISKEFDSIIGFAFIDDTDIVEGDFQMGHLDIDTVFDNMQEAIDRWEGGMKTTGGAIRPDKSFVYPINFTFKPNGDYQYEKVEDMDRALTIKDHNNVRQNLHLVDATEEMETLGIYLAPAGVVVKQFKYLMVKVRQWTSLVKAGHIPPNTAFSSISS